MGFYFLYVREVEMTCAEYPCFVVQIVFLVQFPKASGLGDCKISLVRANGPANGWIIFPRS